MLKEVINDIATRDISVQALEARGMSMLTASKLKTLSWLSAAGRGTQDRAYFLHTLSEAGELKKPLHMGWSVLLRNRPRCPNCNVLLDVKKWNAHPASPMYYGCCPICNYDYASFGGL